MENKKSKPTITVGICALNEQENIVEMLQSLASQKIDSAVLEKIVLISDGSTDQTVTRARSLGLANLEIREYSERAGLANRLNEQLKANESDMLVINDADTVYADLSALESIAKTFLADARVMMVCGHAEPMRGGSFTERAVRCTFDAYAPIKKKWREGQNILSVHGCISAFRKSFASSIELPGDTLGTDIFMYLKCIESGGKYRYAPDAAVFFCLPQTLADHARQNIRQQAARRQLGKYFSKNLIRDEYAFPRPSVLASLAIQLLKHPLLCFYIFLVNRYCSVLAGNRSERLGGKWEMVISTKKALGDNGKKDQS